jgi:SAM-dependent methyltransferase
MSRTTRTEQLAYSELQPKMLEEEARRRKGQKIVSIIEHFLGGSLRGRRVLDVGSSAGFITDELGRAGGIVVGIDIDRPGLAAARARFEGERPFLCARGEQLPFRDDSLDVVIFNHIYEHTVDPVPVMREIRRVLRPGGLVYLGFANRLGVMEPHHRLPFLSYLPQRAADAYMRLARKGDAYHEQFRLRAGLARLAGGLTVWDYTLAVLHEPERFGATRDVPGLARRVPPAVWHAVLPLFPTYLWIGVKGDGAPEGPVLEEPPLLVRTPPEPS